MILYRPVGLKEMELIANANFEAFPPRLEWQPIFYPVLNQPYAEQIALEWNTKDAFSGYCGIVTSFNVSDDFLQRYDIQNVGADMHNELWVPAEELEIFNESIIDKIAIVNVFFGNEYVPPSNIELTRLLNTFNK